MPKTASRERTSVAGELPAELCRSDSSSSQVRSRLVHRASRTPLSCPGAHAAVSRCARRPCAIVNGEDLVNPVDRCGARELTADLEPRPRPPAPRPFRPPASPRASRSRARDPFRARHAPGRRGRSARRAAAAPPPRPRRRRRVPRSDDPSSSALDRERERRSRARIADRVLGEVLRDDAEHPRPDRELDVRVALEPKLDAGPAPRAPELVERPRRARACTGSAPSETTRAPDSSSLRNSTSSISSVIWSTSPTACSISSGMSSPGSAAVSSSVRRRASGVRSSCDTAAVNPDRSSSYAARSPSRER